MTEKTFSVPDMSCSHCKGAVEGALNMVSGVKRANADIVKGTVEVTYDEAAVTTEDLLGAIQEAGYTVAA
jgi:copper chaperone